MSPASVFAVGGIITTHAQRPQHCRVHAKQCHTGEDPALGETLRCP